MAKEIPQTKAGRAENQPKPMKGMNRAIHKIVIFTNQFVYPSHQNTELKLKTQITS